MADCTDYKPLLAGLLDRELTAEETMRVHRHLIRCASCRADYEQLRKAENKLEAISFIEITDEAAHAFWKLPYSRAARTSALALVALGYAILLLYALVEFVTGGPSNVVVKISIAAIVIGFLVFFGLLLLERLAVYKVDPYKEIDR
ncbi:MAG TPA: zf-HC2 domain-containing protein [Gammaproteobacteria bacterium]|nr:zf-HC2 domain-containing protein [Gammaproteobacteria bacterium]